MATFTLWML